MPGAWRLSINGLAGRRSRTALLVGAVALSTALVVAVACALASLNAAMRLRVESTLGRADIRVKHVTESRFGAEVLDLFAQRPEIDLLVPRAKGAIPLRNPRTGKTATVVGMGVDPAKEASLVTSRLDAGREAASDAEIVLDPAAAESLGATVGDRLEVVRFGPKLELLVVGVRAPDRVDMLRRPQATVTRPALEEITLAKGRLSEIEIVLRDGEDAAALAETYQALLPEGLIAQPTERVTSGVGAAMRANTFLYSLASTLAYVAAAFIVLTGLTTNVLERQRELAVLRCIGAERRTLGLAQLGIGAIIGTLGAIVGVPLGIALAWLLTVVFPDRLPAGLATPAGRIAWAAFGATVAGVFGAVWPAINASRVKPLEAMTARAASPRARGIALVTALGFVGLALQLLIVTGSDDAQFVFWGYLIVGLPAMFLGYFLLGVPLSLLVARIAGPPVAALLRVPPAMLVGQFRSTPYRHGFTAGALMVGLAMMTSIWTNGSALLRDWLDAIQFPDAFVHGWFGLSPETQRQIDGLPFVSETCAITLFKIDSNAFGLSEIRNPPTYFVAFEPGPFFRMTKLHWVAGDPEYAKKRLAEGGAVLVAKEFLVKRQGFAIGDSFVVEHAGERHEFEIVGAVSSPGLDVVSYYFDIGKEYANQAISSVFGTREDLKRVFGTDTVQMVQIGLTGELSDDEAERLLREAVNEPAAVVGSGREIKARVTSIGRSTMRIASAIAVAAMLIGCLGVGNIVLAGIDARRFEFGVLRAVGADSWTVGRLVLGEVLLTAITACVLGTGLGIQGSFAGLRMYELLAGLRLNLRPPAAPILLGWAILIVLTLAVAAPLVARLVKQKPRELLGATKG